MIFCAGTGAGTSEAGTLFVHLVARRTPPRLARARVGCVGGGTRGRRGEKATLLLDLSAPPLLSSLFSSPRPSGAPSCGLVDDETHT